MRTEEEVKGMLEALESRVRKDKESIKGWHDPDEIGRIITTIDVDAGKIKAIKWVLGEVYL